LLAVVVLEFCEKGSLKGYVEDNVVPTEQQLLFALDAARGLEYVHSKKFVHR
jgi:serine/threonine protein kinase